MTALRVRRVVLTGSEGTGKTTLAQSLAEYFGAPWIPEYARMYAETAGRVLGAHDVDPIARGQISLEESVLRDDPPLVFLDTDLVSTIVYARHYYGTEPDWLAATVRERLADLYLVLSTDVAWQPDGVRDQPHTRDEVQALFRRQLAELSAKVVEVSGDEAHRFRVAREAVSALLRAAR